jgi:hypothetical protein
LECIAIDRDRRVVGLSNPRKYRGELFVAVDEDRFHGLALFPGHAPA